ncbi:MAG TPA: hypothetical protein P5117_00040 [Spirochaetia bacterium]|nr:hypothetical protein [Spirochaetales bacterium]HRY78939.1 hypothetical protein [Spirochaetia bacterium]HRZ87848.1 hypothetical protein [Spirochaetia bacterium]
MKRTRYIAIVAAVLAALTLASCQDFFTSSFASWAQRDPSVPSGLTADQAMSIADQAVANRDTALAQALLPQMAGLIATGTPPAALVASAVDTAVLASGIDDAFGTILTDIGIEALTDDPTVYAAQIDTIISSIAVDVDSQAIFTALAAADPNVMAAAGATASDYATAAVALVLAEAAANSIDFFSDSPDITTFTCYSTVEMLMDNASATWPNDSIVDVLADFISYVP